MNVQVGTAEAFTVTGGTLDTDYSYADGGSGLYGGTKTIKFKIGTRGFGSWFWWREL